MTDEEYHEYMNKPLSAEEKQLITDNGWVFASEDYIYIPDDYDGCMAASLRSIRKLLLRFQYPDIYIECNGNAKNILEQLQEKV